MTVNPTTNQPQYPLPDVTATPSQEATQPTEVSTSTPTQTNVTPPPQEEVTVQSHQGQAETAVNLIEEEPGDVVAYGKDLFKETFGLSERSYLRPNNAKLKAELYAYSNMIENTPGMRETLEAKNPRAIDFLHTLDKARQGQNLNNDDIEHIQLFLVKDTAYGSELAYKPNDEGIDAKFGFRTHAALHRFVSNFNPSTSLVPNSPDYQRSLDNR